MALGKLGEGKKAERKKNPCHTIIQIISTTVTQGTKTNLKTIVTTKWYGIEMNFEPWF